MELDIFLGEILGLITILLLLRPLVLWYFKINRTVEALESIDESLSYLPAVTQGRAANQQSNRRVA